MNVAASSEDVPDRVRAIEQKLDELSASTDTRFASVDARFDAVDARFDAVDARLDALEGRFAAVDEAFIEQRRYTEFAFERLQADMQRGFSRIERKLDRFIDVQSKTNELVERRLARLEAGG